MNSARRQALEELCRRRPAVPLKDGDHLTVYHALRCRCPKCNRIITWDDADEQGVVTGECCKLVFRLFPWSVKVRIEDTRPEALLPPHQQRNFPLDGDLRDCGVVVGPDPPADPPPSGA